MKKKKRYILLQLEKPISFDRLTGIKIISSEGNQVIILCELTKFPQVVLELEKLCKIINVSGTLKSLRRV